MITIDTNVAARYLLADIPDHYQRVVNLVSRAASGEIELLVPDAVFIELSYILTRLTGIPRPEAASGLLGFTKLPGVKIEHEDTITNALMYWRDHGGVSFVDCFLLALTETYGISQIASFDKKMNRYPGVERIEP